MNKLIISIIIGLLIFGVIILINTNQKQNDIEFNDVKIRGQDYKFIQEKFENYSHIRICDIEKGNCILLTKLKYLGVKI